MVRCAGGQLLSCGFENPLRSKITSYAMPRLVCSKWHKSTVYVKAEESRSLNVVLYCIQLYSIVMESLFNVYTV